MLLYVGVGCSRLCVLCCFVLCVDCGCWLCPVLLFRMFCDTVITVVFGCCLHLLSEVVGGCLLLCVVCYSVLLHVVVV